MYGSIKSQVHYLFHASGIKQYGCSKHRAKEEARAAGAGNWHDIGKKLGIYSYNTANAYRDVWIQAFRYAREHFKVRDLEKINGDHVAAFLIAKIQQGVANATFLQYAAALEKLEVALNLYAAKMGKDTTYDFSQGLREARKMAQVQELPRLVGSRAYKRPEAMVQSIAEATFQLVARVQYEGGARVAEVKFGPDQLRGLRPDPVTGEEKGWLAVRGKGGKWREIHVSPATYRQVEAAVRALAPGEKWGIRHQRDAAAYRRALQAACEKVGESYRNKQGESRGSHGLRWNYVQNRYLEIQRADRSLAEALARTSQEVGHQRADITRHYLR